MPRQVTDGLGLERAVVLESELLPEQVPDQPAAGRVVVGVAAVADDALGVDADEREVDARVVLAAGQPDLAELTG